MRALSRTLVVRSQGGLFCGPLLLGLILTLSVSSWAQEDSAWQTSRAAGIDAFRQGKYSEAVRHFEVTVVRLENRTQDGPQLATALRDLAETYWVLGRYSEAEPLYQKALTIRKEELGAEPDKQDQDQAEGRASDQQHQLFTAGVHCTAWPIPCSCWRASFP